MKKLFLGTVALIALGAAPAMAADLAARPYTKAPPIIPVVYDWTGFYIGGNGGWGTSRKCWDYAGTAAAPLVTNIGEGCHDASGATAGGQIGYNWQFSTWVFGIEAQGNWADFKGSNVSTLFPGFTNESKIEAFGLFTGRIGYAWNNALLYAKGGAAVVSDKYNYYTTLGGLTTGTASETRWGGTVGAGFEYGFTPNWSFAVEYNHLFLDSKDVTFTSPATTVDRIKQDADIVTARINYRWGGPVVARY
ncbi:outer membrane protein [Rhodopseudomonas palustris]|uniref:Porin family protein n=1 Tax=Rhodopseudomonas palustris TaxID=1076 RepID=A0A418V1V6_RHOPL|nr:outer membrane beta-barrel protein [Rhodopseudomonas palustris]RJF69913.1 porin family protein [Rhodopseudomonas palustris]